MAVTGESLGVTFAITVREIQSDEMPGKPMGKPHRSFIASQIGITLVVFIVFSELRISKLYRRFTAPKRFDVNQKVKPKRLGPSLFGWIHTVWWMTETEVIEVAGMDAAVFLRCLCFGYDVFKWVSFWCLVVVLPVNLSGNEVSSQIARTPPAGTPFPPSPPFLPPLLPLPPGYKAASPCPDSLSIDTQNQALSFFDKCSLTNLEFGSSKLWASAVSVYIVTFIVLRIMLHYNREMSLLRILYLANTPRGGPSHTCLITDIPGWSYGTLGEFVRLLVGSTVLFFLPSSMKKRIIAGAESGIGAAGNKVNKVKGGITSVIKKEEQLLDHFKPPKDARKPIEIDDDELDVWSSAALDLGPMDEADDDSEEERLKGFIMRELEYSYGPHNIAAINPVWDQRKIEPLLYEFERNKCLLEDHLDDMAYKLRRRMKPSRLMVAPSFCGKKVDAITLWTERLTSLNERIEAAKKVALCTPIPSTFVTFHTRAAMARAANALHCHDESAWRIQPAPYPTEVIWENLRQRLWERSTRSLLLWVCYIVLLIFYIIPVTIVQGVVNLQNLAKIPGVYEFVNLPFIGAIIQGILPSLVLMIFLAFLPYIIRLMCYLSGMTSLSAIDFGVANRYFIFMVIAVFIYNMVAGSLINQYQAILNNPTAFITILGSAVPQTATFFITYILVAGVMKVGISFLRVPSLLFYILFSKMASTPRAKARVWADQYRILGPILPGMMMPFFLGLIYSCINPIVCPVVLVFYAFAIIAERYNVMYIFKHRYESGGRIWSIVIHQFLLGLYFMQVFMCILLALKGGKGPAPFLVPSIAITLTFHWTVSTLYERPWKVLSIHDAAFLDIRDYEDRGKKDEMTDKELKELKEAYLSPVFKIEPEDLNSLLKEAEITSRRLNGERLEDIEEQIEDRSFEDAEEAEDEDIAAAQAAAVELEMAEKTQASSKSWWWRAKKDSKTQLPN